jgi:type I restriction enzyme S subunit
MAFEGRTLGDVVTLVRGTTYKSALLGQPGPVLLGLASIQRNGGFRSDSLKTYGGESKEKILLRPGDLFVSLKDVTQSADLLGSIARVPTEVALGRLTQDTVKLEFREDSYPPALVYWTLRSPNFRSYCRAHATGTTNLGLPREDFLAYQLPVPAPEVLSLVQLLEGIEKRITLLSQTNATLEAIAQALFKSWFVDFDPVRAKAEGREPEGMDAATAALFPSEFEDSELGPIPAGWCVRTIGDHSIVVDCLHAKKPKLLPEGRPYLQLNCIREDGLLETAAAANISDVDYAKWTSRIEASPGDCVITNVGRVGAVAQVPDGFKAALGRNMTGIRPGCGMPPTFLIELLVSNFMKREIEQKTDAGTILSALNVKSIPTLRFVCAPEDTLSRFEEIGRPLRASMEENLRRSVVLSDLRDTLLPRLISGKLSLPEAEAEVEALA